MSLLYEVALGFFGKIYPSTVKLSQLKVSKTNASTSLIELSCIHNGCVSIVRRLDSLTAQ